MPGSGDLAIDTGASTTVDACADLADRLGGPEDEDLDALAGGQHRALGHLPGAEVSAVGVDRDGRQRGPR